MEAVLLYSLRSRWEWVPARTSVPNASAKSRAGHEKNVEESSLIIIFAAREKSLARSLARSELAASPPKVSRAHPLPPATQAILCITGHYD